MNLLVGPLRLKYAHQIDTRSRIRRRLLRPAIPAARMACFCGSRLRSRPRIRGVQLEPEASITRPQEKGIDLFVKSSLLEQLSTHISVPPLNDPS